ncbi:MAG: transposase [Methylococcaceae bacterium]
MNKKELETFAREAAKSIKIEKDLGNFTQILAKVTVEAALNVELDEHLGYSKHEDSETENSRNGFSSKTLKIEEGQFEVDIPHDRLGEFEPQLVKKHQMRITSMNEKIHSLPAMESEREGW